MGKRKRSISQTKNKKDNEPSPLPPPSSDNIPCSSGTEVLSKEKSSPLVDSSELRPCSPGMDITDNSVKLLNAHASLANHHYNLGRSIFLKKSRHHYGHQYSRRYSGNHVNASSSHGKGRPPLHDERLSFKLAGQCNAELGRNAENREKPFSRPERIRSSSLVKDASTSEGVKMVCGICQKLLRRGPYILGIDNTLSSGEFSVVAVLVCGHVYHAVCLEQRTGPEDGRDPPCPLCLDLPLQADSSGAQE